jgi:acyl-CoA synthetase (AMP-forming)/AMP-acid ligase II
VQLGDLFDLSLIGRAASPALDVDAPQGGLRNLTFGEIDARADRTAHVLAARGVSTVVGALLCQIFAGALSRLSY